MPNAFSEPLRSRVASPSPSLWPPLLLSTCISFSPSSFSPAWADAPGISVPGTSTAPANAAPAKPANAARLFADSVRYEGGVIVAEGRNGRGVRLESEAVRLSARSLRLDVEQQTVSAQGTALVERTREVTRRELLPESRRRGNAPAGRPETVTETLRGDNFQYNFRTRRGSLDKARVELANFNVSTESLIINGQRYIARNVILRPGALTAAERAIYGTPPFNLRAHTVTLETGTEAAVASGSGAPAGVATTNAPESGGGSLRGAEAASASSVKVNGGALYFKNTRLFPVPSYVFRSVGGEEREPQAYSLTPRLSINSVDGALVTTQLRYPLSARLSGLSLNADVGLSARIGLRGGLSLEAPTRFGTFTLSGRRNDIVTGQLTNRIALDREPEITFAARPLPLFRLPGGHVAGFRFSVGAGRFSEHFIGDDDDNTGVDATRRQAGVRFTTRLNGLDGPYLDLFARAARYRPTDDSHRVAGFEIGYTGTVFKRVRGQFSYRATSVSGRTPFRFDRVEIRRELRSTFDVEVTPRYLIPIDLRYDLNRRRFRDERFGVLRSYKTFAYGATYQTARRELKLEFRRGF